MNLPLHPLFVHLPVVLFPLAALAALVFVAVPRWRRYLLWPVSVGALVAFVGMIAARQTGDSLAATLPGMAERIAVHEQRANLLLASAVVFGVGLLLELLTRPGEGFGPRLRPGWVAVAGHVLTAVGAVAVLVTVVLTGDSGARMVWGR
ncbi:DUF2231 domain-containing protein [Aestuariimicrobium soli]|uniref:DUF2231 domain-containing protein n=1 Tax=Aestuariimicrobium soli TaxID=2035834 RepID=UPI003EB788F6